MMSESRRITVQYFAILREERGCSEEEIDTPAASALELFEELRQRHGFSLETDRFKVVINEEFRDWSEPINDGDTIVFVPPVAGG